MQPLQQHFLSQHENEFCRFHPVKIDSFDDYIQRRIAIATVPNGTIRAAKYPGHNELHAGKLTWKVAVEQVALDVSGSWEIQERLLAWLSAPDATVIARYHRSFRYGRREQKMPLLRLYGVQTVTFQAVGVVDVAHCQ